MVEEGSTYVTDLLQVTLSDGSHEKAEEGVEIHQISDADGTVLTIRVVRPDTVTEVNPAHVVYTVRARTDRDE